jgi:hypothetical protein
MLERIAVEVADVDAASVLQTPDTALVVEVMVVAVETVMPELWFEIVELGVEATEAPSS